MPIDLEWRPIAGCDGYEVSDLGNIKSPRGRILRPGMSGTGYLYVNLPNPVRSKRSRSIHEIVAEAFLGPKPRGMFVDHADGDKKNSSATNLRYCTKAQNCQNIKARHGCASRFKGVSWHGQNKSWRARIRSKLIGLFQTELEAAAAYNKAAATEFGKFAKLNEI